MSALGIVGIALYVGLIGYFLLVRNTWVLRVRPCRSGPMNALDYEIRSAAGILIFTTPDKDLAMKEARAKAVTFPGLRIDAVERFENRRRIWSDRAYLRLVGAA